MRKLLLITALLGAMMTVKGQNGSEEFGAWYKTTLMYQFSDKVYYEGLYTHRLFKLGGDFQQNVWRSGLRYKIDKQHYVSAGFDFLNTEQYVDAGFHHEYRPWIHFGQKTNLGRWTIDNRFRFESRSLVTNGEDSDYQVRFRYRLVLKAPINGEKIEPGVAYFQFFDEVMLSFIEAPYNQNWFQVGLGYKASPKLAVELGYFNQYINSQGFHRMHLTLGWSINKRQDVPLDRVF